MLDALRFVASAVAKKDYVPELTHFKIKEERITGFNGIIGLSSDIDVNLDVCPQAAKLIAAVRACPETISLNMTPAGKLAVRSGKFKSFVDCLPEEPVAFVEPEGEDVSIGESFLPGLKRLAPLMGVDASRPWAMGIRLSGQSMFATNNTMFAEYWAGDAFPIDVVIPAVAIEELLRIGENPTRVQMTDRSISFWFGEKRWMRSSLVEASLWPNDKMKQLLDELRGEVTQFTDGFFDAVNKLKPFIEEAGTVFVSPGMVATSRHDGEGTSIELTTGVPDMQAYHHKNLLLLGEVATGCGWQNYPRPCLFIGDRLRGAIVGQRID